MNADELLARFDRIPAWPYPKRLLFIVGIGFFFSFFDIVTIGLALPRIESLFHISMSTATWAITSSLIGYIIGSLLLARISDKLGRKLALYFSILLFSVGSILTAFSTTFAWIVVFRFITGMGIGAEISEVSTYMGEVSPARYRGRFTTIAIAFGMLGFAVVPFVALGLVTEYTWGFRAMFLIGGLAGIIIFFMRRNMPETIRWLVEKNKLQEAEVLLLEMEARVSKKITLPKVVVRLAEEPITYKAELSFFKSLYCTRVLLFIAIWFFYYIGNYAWLTLSADLFYQHGFGLAKSLKLVAIDSSGFVIGSLLAVFAGDRIERKVSCIIGGVIWVAALLWIGCAPNLTTIIVGGLIASTTIGFMIPVMYTYTAEQFPTTIRATGVAISDGFGHLGGAFCGQIVLTLGLLFSDTFAGNFTVMAASGIMTVLLLTCGVRMTNKSLL